MTKETLSDEWQQTDGSDETLQYGRKLNDTTWEYMEWTDKPWDEVTRDAEYKLANLDDNEWKVETVDLNDYTQKQILSAIECYGYKFHNFVSSEQFNITQNGHIFSIEESVQLSCECIFEQDM